jgi:putative DNA primase/helicase
MTTLHNEPPNSKANGADTAGSELAPHAEQSNGNGYRTAQSLRRKLEAERAQLQQEKSFLEIDLKTFALHPEWYTTEKIAGIRDRHLQVGKESEQALKVLETLAEEFPEKTRPTIHISTNITEMVDAAQQALIDLPGPVLYQRAKMICRIAPAGDSPKWLQRPPDAPTITRADTVSLREYSGQSAQWMKYDKRAKEWSLALPSAVALETLAGRLTWKFPYLEGVICAPTLRPDGVLITSPGYDAETGLYLDLNGVAFPPVSAAPTLDDAKAALDLLHTPFADFPFKEEYHRSAALAAVLTLVGRFAIPSSVPAFPVRAHAKGAGKGLLVNTIAMIGTGRTAPTWTQTLDEAEEAKRLLSIALAGDACMHLDNITKPFGSAKLDSALTSATVKDRLLGGNTNQEAPWLTVIFASGNNMTFVGDMVRRVVPIDLDPKVEHPEQRGDFRHTPLLEWVKKERPQLVVAALTVLKAFFHAGCPKQPNVTEFGSFEAWSNLIRHSLIWAGFPDPCEGRKNLEEESDTSYEALATLLHCWADCYPDTQARTLKVITQDIERRKTPDPSAVTPANEWNALHEALSTYDSKYDGKRLDTKRIGNALRTIEGRVLDNQRLIRAGEFRRATEWKREIVK